MLRIKSAQDFGAGAMFFLVGLGALWFGREYEVGTAAQMGPGYFPRALGIGLLVFGAIFVLRGLAWEGPPIEASRSRVRSSGEPRLNARRRNVTSIRL